jgi:hypothetical protein
MARGGEKKLKSKMNLNWGQIRLKSQNPKKRKKEKEEFVIRTHEMITNSLEDRRKNLKLNS